MNLYSILNIDICSQPKSWIHFFYKITPNCQHRYWVGLCRSCIQQAKALVIQRLLNWYKNNIEINATSVVFKLFFRKWRNNIFIVAVHCYVSSKMYVESIHSRSIQVPRQHFVLLINCGIMCHHSLNWHWFASGRQIQFQHHTQQ